MVRRTAPATWITSASRSEPFDEEAIRETLTGRGYRAGAVEPRYGARGDGPSIYLEDPEGNTVELKGPPFTAAGKADDSIQRMTRSPSPPPGEAVPGQQQ